MSRGLWDEKFYLLKATTWRILIIKFVEMLDGGKSKHKEMESRS